MRTRLCQGGLRPLEKRGYHARFAWARTRELRRQISVTDANKIKIHRIVSATDCGYAVNPAQIERQIAGSTPVLDDGSLALVVMIANVRIHSPEAGSFQFSQIPAMPNGPPSLMAIAYGCFALWPLIARHSKKPPAGARQSKGRRHDPVHPRRSAALA